MTTLPVPMIDQFWKNMIEWAGYLSAKLASPTMDFDSKLGLVYYDGQANAQKVRDYSKDPKFDLYIQQCHDAYVTKYVNPNRGRIQGFRTFTEGQLYDVLAGNSRASNSLLSMFYILANQNYLSTDKTVIDVANSRDCAYALMAIINAMRTGHIRLSAQMEAWRNFLLSCILDHGTGHVAMWKENKAPFVRPFMLSLTARALIMYNTYMPKEDPRIVPAVKDLCDTAMRCWKEKEGPWGQGQSFTYTDRTGIDPEDGLTTPDLNMLIVPMFGYVYYKTRDMSYRTQGDLIWKGGVSVYDQWGYHAYGASLGTKSASNPAGKQYNQQLYWGPDYIKWAMS